MPNARMNVALKVTWVYGEDGPWTSPCTPEGRLINILKEHKVWCSQPECPCNPLQDTDDRLPVGTVPWYDCRAPHDFRFASGVNQKGSNAGKSIPMEQTGVGKLAFLTSRSHEMTEDDRIILACFRIDEVGEYPELKGHAVWAEAGSLHSLRVPPDRLDEAPRFWDFRKTDKEPLWGSGLFRYIPDDEARAMWEAVEAACDTTHVTVLRDLQTIRLEEEYIEGQKTTRLVSYYERNPDLRSAAVAIHGTRCQACDLHFGEVYGELGEGYIEAHHLKPVSEYEGDEVAIDPEEDMAVVCSNCHRMLHRRKNDPLTVQGLRSILRSRGVLEG